MSDRQSIPNEVDVTILTDQEIREAIIYHCTRMGSTGYYIEDEIARWKGKPACLTIYRDHENGRLRGYTDGRG